MTNQEVEQKIKEEIERCKEHYKEELDSYWLGRIDALNFVSMLNDLKSKDDISEKPRTKIKLSEIIANATAVIHIHSIEEADTLLKKLNKFGFYIDDLYWNFYREDTCYHICSKTYGSYKHFKKEKFTIIEFKDVDLAN